MFWEITRHQNNQKRNISVSGLCSGLSCEIVQLAAVSGAHSLSLYSVPRCRVQPRAAAVTGFRVRRHKLYLHRKPVLTNSLREVLIAFIAFLRMLQWPLVIGHNIRRFDCRVLARALDECDLRTEFVSVISGCLDTLPLARELLKDAGLQSFCQEALVRTILGVSYKAHDALEDVSALQMLYTALEPTPEQVLRHAFLLETTAGPPARNLPCSKTEGPCKLSGQRPLWEHLRQAVKISEEQKEASEDPESWRT